ncbi:MAG: pseudouridine synthase [Ginsengibacter sp.]
MPNRYFIINKPFNMVSQFVSNDNVRLLGNLNYPFPEGTHAIGRLDNNSEGLLILSTNKKLTRLLFQSEVPHKRKYLVQVNDTLSNESIARLQNGVTFKTKGSVLYQTLPCEANITDKPEKIFTNGKVINENQPTCWLHLTLTEGKYHQVRKMIKAVRHRCLRLIRISIEELELGNLQPGQVLEIEEAELFSKLGLSM